jgi:endonuclease/exonuclease/phosphatase (EEP) superfamily protein YafD
MDANVENDNPSMAGYASQIKATDPTLLTMEEAVPGDEPQLQRSGALDRLPYRFTVGGDDPSSFLVASRYPLVGTRVIYFRGGFHGPFHGGPPGAFPGAPPGAVPAGPPGGGSFPGQPLIVETTIHLPSGDQALWVLHTTAPYPRFFFSAWQDQLALINQQIRKRGTAGLLVVGDFNATWGNKGFRTILDNGLTDGAAARGHPFQMTWSQVEHPLPPFVRIDHVLTGSRVAVTQIETGPGPGSDHRDLHVTIAVER